MIRCLHCSAETSNGLALCDLCQEFGRTCLEYLPTYFRNLSRQRRPGRPNGSVGGGRGGISEGGSASVIAALGRAENDVSTWVRTLADDRDVELPEADTEAEMFTAVCLLLGVMLTTIATLEWAGQFIRDIAKHERILRDITETTIPGWYAGTCRQVTGRTMEGDVFTCDTPTYVIPGLTWVTCRGCGATTYARDHLEIVLEEARDWVARPREIAGALVALLDAETDVIRLWERTRRWGRPESVVKDKRTGKVKRVIPAGPLNAASMRRRDADGDEVGPRLFRLGDVLDQLQRETRALERTA